MLNAMQAQTVDRRGLISPCVLFTYGDFGGVWLGIG
jgi:hypothetical protein